MESITKDEGDTQVKVRVRAGAAAPEAQPARPIHQIATRSVTGRLKGKNKRDASPPTSPIPTKRQGTAALLHRTVT